MRRFGKPNCKLSKVPTIVRTLPFELYAALCGWVSLIVGILDYHDLVTVDTAVPYAMPLWLILCVYGTLKLTCGLRRNRADMIGSGSVFIGICISIYGAMAVVDTYGDTGWVRLGMGLTLLIVAIGRKYHLEVTSLNVEEYLASDKE